MLRNIDCKKNMVVKKKKVEDKCIPSILQYVRHMSLQDTDAVWGQFFLLSHEVELSGEHESCKRVKESVEIWSTGD